MSEAGVINHEEALQLAELKRDESNLARCYIDHAATVQQLQQKISDAEQANRLVVDVQNQLRAELDALRNQSPYMYGVKRKGDDYALLSAFSEKRIAEASARGHGSGVEIVSLYLGAENCSETEKLHAKIARQIIENEFGIEWWIYSTGDPGKFSESVRVVIDDDEWFREYFHHHGNDKAKALGAALDAAIANGGE